MIYCVIPRELEDELYDKMVEYYKDNPNVEVIVDRREGPDRRAGKPAGEFQEKRLIRDRRRRGPGSFPDTEPPEAGGPGATRIAPMATGDAKNFQNIIDGEGVDAAFGETFRSKSPADGETIGVFPRSGPADVDRAVEAAKAAYEEWRLVPAPKRGEVLFRFAQLLAEHKDDVTELMTHEMGKVKAE